MAKRLVTEMVVFTDSNPITDDCATYISVEDEGGRYFEIRQPGMHDFVLEKATIRLNFNEIDEIYDALRTLRAQWEMAGLG